MFQGKVVTFPHLFAIMRHYYFPNKQHFFCKFVRLTHVTIIPKMNSPFTSFFTVLFLFLSLSLSYGQTLVNGELNGPWGNNLPTGWQSVPVGWGPSQANMPIAATTDIVSATMPGGTSGNLADPYSGTTCLTGLHSQTVGGGALTVYHEGIRQTVSGFTPGTCYDISFYQSVVKQISYLDPSGSWEVFVDMVSIGVTAPSTSNLAYNDPFVTWDARSFNFTATSTSHEIAFLPMDDDANSWDDADGDGVWDLDGGLRMGLDYITITPGGIPPVITAVGPFCTSDQALLLDVNVLGGTWSGTGITDASTGNFDPAIAGPGSHVIEYTITSCGMLLTVQTTIEILEVPTADFAASPMLLSDPSELVQFDNNSQNADSYTWDFGDGSSTSNAVHPSHTFASASDSWTVTLVASNNGLCYDSTSLVITLIGGSDGDIADEVLLFVPNSFTPNGSGLNEVFQPVLSDPDAVSDFNFAVFNRWGERIFESGLVSEGWNGQFLEFPVDQGIYTWKVEFIDTNTQQVVRSCWARHSY